MRDVFFYIIVVSYNAGDALINTLTSIRRQTYPYLRVLIKDGGSDDDSLERARERFSIDASGESADHRIRLVSSRDHGIYDAMNEGVALALEEEAAEKHKRPLIYFLNCGDTLFSEGVLAKVSELVSDVPEHGSAPGTVFYGDVQDFVTGEEIPSNPKISDFACYRNVPCHQACFYDMALMEKAQFNPRFVVRADYEHFLRLNYRYGAAFHYLPLTVASYEGGGFSEQAENIIRSEEERKRIIRHYLPAWKVRVFDLYRVVSLQKVRERLAKSGLTAAAYNRVKKWFYKRK